MSAVAAACGDDDEATSDTTSDTPAATEAPQETAAPDTEPPSTEPSSTEPSSTEPATTEPSGEADGVIEVEPKTIAFLNIAGAANAAKTIAADVEAAVAALGWELDTCDGQGDPQKIASCMVTLVQKDPDAVLTMSVAPAAMADGLQLAEERGIPVINIGGETEDASPFAGVFVPDDTEMSRLLTERMISDLAGEDTAKIGVFYSDANYAQRLRGEELRRLVEGTNVEIAASVQSTYTNPFEESARDAESMLRADPDIQAFWASSGSFNLAGIATTLVALDRLDVRSYGYFCEEILQDLIKQDQVTAILCVTLGQTGWDAIDALVMHFETGQDIGSVPPPVDYRYEVLDKSTIDNASDFFTGYQDVYIERWDREF